MRICLQRGTRWSLAVLSAGLAGASIAGATVSRSTQSTTFEVEVIDDANGKGLVGVSIEVGCLTPRRAHRATGRTWHSGATRLDDSIDVRSGAAGRATFTLEGIESPWIARFIHEGYHVSDITLDPEEPGVSTVRLERTATLSGRIREGGERFDPSEFGPLRVRATAWMAPRDGPRTFHLLDAAVWPRGLVTEGAVAPDGTFVVEGIPPRAQRLTLSLVDEFDLEVGLPLGIAPLVPGEDRSMDWNQLPRCGLDVEVLAHDGSPRTGVSVFAVPEPPGWGEYAPDELYFNSPTHTAAEHARAHAVTNGEGVARLTDLPTGRYLVGWFEPREPGMAGPCHLRMVTLPVIESLTLENARRRTLTGTALHNGVRIDHQTLVSASGHWGSQIDIVREDGSFELKGLPMDRGPVELRAWCLRAEPRLCVVPTEVVDWAPCALELVPVQDFTVELPATGRPTFSEVRSMSTHWLDGWAHSSSGAGPRAGRRWTSRSEAYDDQLFVRVASGLDHVCEAYDVPVGKPVRLQWSTPGILRIEHAGADVPIPYRLLRGEHLLLRTAAPPHVEDRIALAPGPVTVEWTTLAGEIRSADATVVSEEECAVSIVR